MFGGSGVALLLATDAMLSAWPWTLTRLLARVYAAFFLSFAVGAALAALERRVAAVRPFLVGSIALLAFTLLASLIHLAKVDHGAGRWVWFLTHALGLGLLGFALATLNRGAVREGRPAPVQP